MVTIIDSSRPFNSAAHDLKHGVDMRTALSDDHALAEVTAADEAVATRMIEDAAGTRT